MPLLQYHGAAVCRRTELYYGPTGGGIGELVFMSDYTMFEAVDSIEASRFEVPESCGTADMEPSAGDMDMFTDGPFPPVRRRQGSRARLHTVMAPACLQAGCTSEYKFVR